MLKGASGRGMSLAHCSPSDCGPEVTPITHPLPVASGPPWQCLFSPIPCGLPVMPLPLALVGPSEDSPRHGGWSLELGLHSPPVSDSKDLYASFGKKRKTNYRSIVVYSVVLVSGVGKLNQILFPHKLLLSIESLLFAPPDMYPFCPWGIEIVTPCKLIVRIH